MFAVKGIYEENRFLLNEPVPVQEKYDVVITFTNPVKKQQHNLLQFVGMFDNNDVQLVQEIIDCRENFFEGMPKL